MNSSCWAGEESKKLIKRSLDSTKKYMGIEYERDWLNFYYQYANRLAHLFFLRELNKNPVFLLFNNFLNDPEKPTSQTKWEHSISEVHKKLGKDINLKIILLTFSLTLVHLRISNPLACMLVCAHMRISASAGKVSER